MTSFLVSLPFWLIWLATCFTAGIVLLPIWYVSHNRRRQRSLRLEVTLWRADKLLQSAEPLNLRISELRDKTLFVDFSNEIISYCGKKIQWQLPFEEVKSWRVYDANARSNELSSEIEPALWVAEFKDNSNAYTLDGSFIENSESIELLKAACVRAFGSNEQTQLEGLRLELAKSERILHQINSGNINVKH